MVHSEGKIEVSKEPYDDIMEVVYWESIEDSERYLFKITAPGRGEITPVVEKEPDSDLIESITYVESMIDYLDHEELEDRNFSSKSLLEPTEVRFEVKKELEEEGYKVNTR